MTSEVKKWEIAKPGDMNLWRVTASDRVLAGSYDYVIVGAGSAGCVVARRLLDRTGATVLLLEAGRPQPRVAAPLYPPRAGGEPRPPRGLAPLRQPGRAR